MPSLVTCPACGSKTQLVESHLGQTVRCFVCQHRFIATLAPDPSGGNQGPAVECIPDQRGPGRHRLPLCPACHRPVGWDDRHCPHCSRLFEPDEERRGSLQRRRDSEEHRGLLIVRLGYVTVAAGCATLCLGPLGLIVSWICGITALILANRDLDLMSKEMMDPAGKVQTANGRIIALSGLVVSGFFAVFFVLLAMTLL